MLLPHEFLHAILLAGPDQICDSLTGGLTGTAIAEFWQHLKQHQEWCNHPALHSGLSFELLLPLIWHIDGAEVYNNAEYITWSYQSHFAKGDIWDRKLLWLIIPFAWVYDSTIMHDVHREVPFLLHVTFVVAFDACGLLWSICSSLHAPNYQMCEIDLSFVYVITNAFFFVFCCGWVHKGSSHSKMVFANKLVGDFASAWILWRRIWQQLSAQQVCRHDDWRWPSFEAVPMGIHGLQSRRESS